MKTATACIPGDTCGKTDHKFEVPRAKYNGIKLSSFSTLSLTIPGLIYNWNTELSVKSGCLLFRLV